MVVLLWTLFSMSMSLLYWGTRTEHNTTGADSPMLNRGEGSLLLTFRRYFAQDAERTLSNVQKGHTADSWSTSCPSDSQAFFCKDAIQLSGAWSCSLQGSELCTSLCRTS